MRTMLKLTLKDILIGVIGNWWIIFLWCSFTFLGTPFAIAAGMVSVVLVSSFIGFDEKSRIDTLYCSLPIKRSTYVLSKYLSTFSVLAAVAIIIFLTRLIMDMFVAPGVYRAVSLRDIFYLIFPLTIIFSIYFPVHFKMGGGVEKSAGLIIIVVLLALCVGTILTLVALSIENEIFKIKHIYQYLTMIIVFFLVTSMVFSIKFYARRDIS